MLQICDLAVPYVLPMLQLDCSWHLCSSHSVTTIV